MKKLNEVLTRQKKLMGINEGINPGLLYRGSTYDIDRFDLSQIKAGQRDVHGFGIYLTDNPEIAKFYAMEYGGNRTKFIYTVKLVNVDTLLGWEDVIESYQAEEIYRQYSRTEEDENLLSDMADTLGLSDGYYGQHPMTSQLYGYLEAILGSKEAASRLLFNCDINGIVFRSKENGFDSMNYNIFDPSNTRIVDKEIIE